jgi:hypothetical protein
MLIILFRHLWVVELTCVYFCRQVHFKLSCSLILFPLFATGVVDTGGKFATGVVDTGGNGVVDTGVADTSGLPCLANISVNFSKKLKLTQLLFSGAWGKVIHEKKPEAKNLVKLSL